MPTIDPRRFLPKFLGGTSTKTEEVLEKRETLSFTMEDSELCTLIDKRIKDASPKKQEVDAINDRNEKFFLGDQIDEDKLFDHQAKIVDNKIYSSIETIVPILATKKREPYVMPAQQTDESRELSLLSRDFLSWKYDEQRMHLKLAELVRFFNMHRICAMKYFYTEKGGYNDFVVEVKRPECLVIDNKSNPEDIEFIAEYLEDTAQGLVDKFATSNDKVNGSKKKKILQAMGITDKQMDSKVMYIEYWTPEFVVWKLKNVVLDKAKNPNWLWDTKGKKFNHFSKPKMPYVLFSWMNMGKGAYGETTSLEQAISLQRNINKRQRQIADNADQASGTWIFNEKYITRKEAAKFVGAPNQHIMFNGEDGSGPNEAVGRLFPKELGVQVFNNLNENKAELDNIFGTHSTTRGERTAQKTATESTLLKQSDFGRLDLMSQYIDMKVEEVFNAFIQMSLVYYDEEKGINILGPDNSYKYFEYSRDNVEEGIEIIVKSEPLLAQAEMMEKYMALYQNGAVDPLTMYERLNLPNPKELTRRMVLFQSDPRMYLAQYAVDEDTEGMEDDPVVQAKKDIQMLEQGEPVEPSSNITREHIREHEKYMKSQRFKKLKDEVKQNMIDHVRAEMEVLRGSVQTVGGSKGSVAMRPMGGGMTQPAVSQFNQQGARPPVMQQ